MKYFIKTMLVVWASIMSLVAVPAVRADDILQVEGKIVETYNNPSTIVIAPEGGGDNMTIQGFPFNNLEAQLTNILADSDGITIEVGDCVSVKYFEKELNPGKIVNKWESLTNYCEEFTEPCYEGESLARKPQQSHRPFPWPGQGKPEPPGKALGLPN